VVEVTHVSSARSEILSRIRATKGTDPLLARDVPVSPAHAPDDLVARFVERVEDYRATVTRSSAAEVGQTVTAICERHGARRVAAPPAIELPAGLEVLRDDPPLDVGVLDAVDGVVTGSALGIAETGTIVLDGGPASGRRALSLIPDLHVCVVRASDLVAGVPEAIAAMAEAVHAGRPITLISGPSATSDIELDRVEGVHGPRRLEVVLVDSSSARGRAGG
jgi:L-lactate dehydrogenase complex protein LldG